MFHHLISEVLLDVGLVLTLRGLHPKPGVAHGAASGVGVDVVVDVGLKLLQTVLGEGLLAQRAVKDGLDLVSGLRG